MRTLTIDNNWKDWKFGDTDAVMTLTATDDGQTPDFTNKTLTFKIANTANNDLEQPKDFAATAPGYIKGNAVQLKTEDVKQLTPGNYVVELWAMDNDTHKDAVYPSKGFAQFTIEENSMKVSDITNISSMTLNAFWNAVMQKVGTLTKGAKGDPGQTPKIVIGTVTKLSPDAQPSATLVPLQNDPNTYTLNLQLPQGAQGIQGLPGQPGVGSKGLDGNDGLTPTIDPKTKHWMIGGTDTGVVAEGQAGKNADTSKFITVVSFNQLRQKVQNNEAALEAMQKSTSIEELKTRVSELSANVANLTAQVKELQEAKSDTPKPDDPVKMQSFSLDHNDITGKVGDKLKVSISNIKPDNTTNGNITATSKDPAVATVTPEADSLTADISLLKAGQTEIEWKSNDGGASKTLKVTVTEATPETSKPVTSSSASASGAAN